jgi:hypothetical protein
MRRAAHPVPGTFPVGQQRIRAVVVGQALVSRPVITVASELKARPFASRSGVTARVSAHRA